MVRLRQANEEKAIKAMEIAEVNKEIQEEKFRQQRLT